MKKINVLAATAIVDLGIAATSCDSKPSANLKSAVDSASYAIGVSTGAGYKENLKTLPGGEANIDALIAGFVQAIKGDSTKTVSYTHLFRQSGNNPVTPDKVRLIRFRSTGEIGQQSAMRQHFNSYGAM